MKANNNILASLSITNMQQLTATVVEKVANIATAKTPTISSNVMQTLLRGRYTRSNRVVFDFSGNAC
jgi:hypothetical protein